MAKRFTIIFFIVLAVIIFMFAGFFLVLLLAPGFSAFGLRYIAKDARAFDSGEVSITQRVSQIGSGEDVLPYLTGIKIETDEVPVYVTFTQDWDYIVQYYDNYNGFTTTDIPYPSLSITMESGVIHVKTSEFKKFVTELGSSKRYLTLKVPLRQVGDIRKGQISLEVDAGNANVKFDRESLNGAADERVPDFLNFNIKTNGSVSYKTHIVAQTYTYETTRKITIPENKSNSIDATNYILTSNNSSIVFESAVAGDITAKTGYGDIKLVSCGGTLNATTTSGNIFSSKSDAPISVTGLVIIKTKSGNVTLGNVSGQNGNSQITTGSGNVKIAKINGVDVNTTRGSVEIKSLGSANIKTNLGKVVVEEAMSNINVETKRGNVYLGGEQMTINNAKVFSRLGRITMYSASGDTNLETISGNINFTNANSSNITINCGGKLNARRLTGKVNISSSKNVELEFASITDEVNIELKNTCYNVNILCSTNSRNDVRYSLTGKYIEIWEGNGTGGYSKTFEGENSANGSSNASAPLIKVNGEFANIIMYFQSATRS